MTTSIQETFSKNVRRLREKAGLSQEKLAELSGLHRTSIGSIERKASNISMKFVGSIADALGVEPVKLFVNDENERIVERILATPAGSGEEGESVVLPSGGFGLCEWGEDGELHVEALPVPDEDLTLRILCALINQGYGDNIDELVAAYNRVVGPITEFMSASRDYESDNHPASNRP